MANAKKLKFEVTFSIIVKGEVLNDMTVDAYYQVKLAARKLIPEGLTVNNMNITNITAI